MEPNTDWAAALNDLQKAQVKRRKAELEVIAAARKFLGITYDTGRPVDFQFMTEWISVAIEIKNAVRALDALESEATDGK